jgi:hypothetical protein
MPPPPVPNWAEISIAFLTILITVVNFATFYYNYYYYRIQIDPYIVVYATNDINLQQFTQNIILVIESIGRGLATDIRFDLSEQMYMQLYNNNDPPK